MKIYLTNDELAVMRRIDYSCEPNTLMRILASFPNWENNTVAEWNLPDDGEIVEIIRGAANTLEDKSVFEKMEAQTIRGRLNINIGNMRIG